MRSDFEPVHLQNANIKLDTLLWYANVPMEATQTQDEEYENIVLEPLPWYKKLIVFLKSVF